MNIVNALVGFPFHNKNLAEFIIKEWLTKTIELKYFIEKDRQTTIYKCKRKDDLLFHIIVNKQEEVDLTDSNRGLTENCNISLFIYKGNECEFKVYAYSLLEKMISHIEPNI